ncbi:MAG: hypothetical protein JRI25_00045 [Deltaproteobacteria bacterium]|nr:hypothetical protein [Deltaproteobacteria bacterium]MBW2252967.1 hypothetical protein [Deltaproteobacteria bacterium]
MKPFARLSVAAVFAAVVFGSPVARAQETGVAGELERTATTTPQEKLEYAEEATQEMRDAIREATRMVESARKDNEVERLQCVTARLTSLRSLLQVSESAQAAMQQFIEAGELERADHELRKIAVARTKTRALLAEAERCVSGTTALEPGETIVVVEGGEFIDESGLLDIDEDPFDLGNDPPEASPFQ